MTNAPERIWLDAIGHGADHAASSEPVAGAPEYLRADLARAQVAAALDQVIPDEIAVYRRMKESLTRRYIDMARSVVCGFPKPPYGDDLLDDARAALDAMLEEAAASGFRDGQTALAVALGYDSAAAAIRARGAAQEGEG